MKSTHQRLQAQMDSEISANLDYLVKSKQWNIYRGRFVNAVEACGESIVGAPCLTTNAGTSAIELALRAHGIGPGDDVVIPSSTFVATAQAILLTGARPVLCEVDQETFNLEPEQVRAALTPRTRAVIFVHAFGNPSGAGRVGTFCAERGLTMLEDAAQALGGRLGSRPVGTLGTSAAFSFNSSKPVSCGDGGMLATTDPAVHEKAKAIRHAGLRAAPDGRFLASEIGGKLLMTELQAAVLVPQLNALPELLQVRTAAALALRDRVTGISEHSRLQRIDDDAVSAWQRVAVTLNTLARAEESLVTNPWLERFYAAPLVDEPVIARHALCTDEVAHHCRDLWGRLVGITLQPFEDFTQLLAKAAPLRGPEVSGQ